MDCDGRRQLLITDVDGTFSGGKAGDTIISKAEYEWDGNPSFGLGMFYFATQCHPPTLFGYPTRYLFFAGPARTLIEGGVYSYIQALPD